MPEVTALEDDATSRRGRADFDEVFVEAYERLVRSVTVACGDAHLAADCVADAFERAYVRWWRISRYDDPVGWIRRVALNRATDAHRARTRHRRLLAGVGKDAVEAPGADDEADLGGDPQLHRAIARLSPRQREVVLAFYVEERPVAEIARAAGLTDGAVKFHLHQARSRLRELLSDDDGAPEVSR